MVAERGSVTQSPPNHSSAVNKTPQNYPPIRDGFDVHSSDDDVLSICGGTANSIFGKNSSPFRPVERKENLTVIIDNERVNREPSQLKSAVVVPSRPRHNPFKSNRGKIRQSNQFNREHRQTFRPNSPRSSRPNNFNRQLPQNLVRGQNKQLPTNVIVSSVAQNQVSCPCAHSCNSKSVAPAIDNGKVTIDIADLQKILDAKATPKAKSKRGLSSGQRKRLKKAAENKLKRELGFDKWWELMRAQESNKKQN